MMILKNAINSFYATEIISSFFAFEVLRFLVPYAMGKSNYSFNGKAAPERAYFDSGHV